MRLAQKILAVLQSLLQVWVTVYLLYSSVARPLPAYADRITDKAGQGQSLGLGLIPNASGLASQDGSGQINLNWKGQTSTFSPNSLFSDSQNTGDPQADEAYGNDAQVMNRAQAEAQAMAGSPSLTGQAYRTLTGSVNRARFNMSNDPLWGQTDAAIERVLSGIDSNCEIVSTTETTTTTAHVPDYQTCERVLFPGVQCQCRHDYTVEPVGQYRLGASCGPTTGGCSITVNALTGEVSGGSLTAWDPPPATACDTPEEGVIRPVATFMPYAGVTLVQTPTCDNGFVAVFFISHSSSNPEYLQTGNLAVNLFHIVDHGWTCDPGCELFLTDADGDAILRPHRDCTTQPVCQDVLTGYDEFGYPTYENQCHDEENCTSGFTCTQGPCDTSTQISGAWVDQSNLYSPNPFASVGISNLAHEVTIALEGFNQGQLNCWTDPQGEVHCPENLGDRADTCGDLENNPACSYVRQECIEGAQAQDSGACYAWTVIYDCGQNVGIDDFTTTTGYQCDGIIRCLGEDCVNGQFDPNNPGFARAAAMLQVLQYAAGDLDCTGGDCRVWNGDKMECKKALGGWVDCCQEPEGVSLVSYIKLLTESFTLTSMDWNLEGIVPGLTGNPFQGTWADLSGYTDAALDFVDNMFTSAWDSLVGASETVAEVAAPTIMQSLSQRLMMAAYEFLVQQSPDLAFAIFDFAEFSGEIIFSQGIQMFMSVVSFISWLYTIYNVLDILVHIIWACEQSELELGAKKQLKACHYVGSHCEGFLCIEKRDTYCCYDSPLARIMQEQIRAQAIDGGWGSAKHPNCRGLMTSQLELVNWDAVDLSEWLGLLALGGEYPTQRQITIDGLTGSGSQFNFGNTSAPRPDAAERTLERIEQSGEDLEQLRIQGGLNLWGQGSGH